MSLTIALLGLATNLGGLPRVSPEREIARLAADYGIVVEVLKRPRKVFRNDYWVSGRPVSPETLAAYVPILREEWRRYPKSLVRKTHLTRLVIGTDVRVNDAPRAAVPEFAPGWYWLDADIGSRKPEYGRKVLHHDYFHMIDEWDSPDGRRDAAWEALNPPGTRYGEGGWHMQTGDVGRLRSDLPGFLTMYSTSAVEEDKAEVFAHMLVSPAFVAERVRVDPVIAAKVARIRSLMAGFGPEFRFASR